MSANSIMRAIFSVGARALAARAMLFWALVSIRRGSIRELELAQVLPFWLPLPPKKLIQKALLPCFYTCCAFVYTREMRAHREVKYLLQWRTLTLKTTSSSFYLEMT